MIEKAYRDQFFQDTDAARYLFGSRLAARVMFGVVRHAGVARSVAGTTSACVAADHALRHSL
jgi:hypothetical protein